jgi:hypothetical protein
MKKQLIIIGIVTLLVCVGLSGCTDYGIGLTNIGDITANSQNYVGKKVTIQGTCGTVGNYGIITDESAHFLYFKFHGTLNGRYRLTGTIKSGSISNGICGNYIDVEKATGI